MKEWEVSFEDVAEPGEMEDPPSFTIDVEDGRVDCGTEEVFTAGFGNDWPAGTGAF